MYAAKLLGDLGADVFRLEPHATGNQTCADTPDGLLLYLTVGKQVTAKDVDECLDLAAQVDVVIEDSAPNEQRLGPDRLRLAKASLVVVSVTPFGQWGPRATWRGNDLIAFHSSGFAHGFP